MKWDKGAFTFINQALDIKITIYHKISTIRTVIKEFKTARTLIKQLGGTQKYILAPHIERKFFKEAKISLLIMVRDL